MGRWPQTKVTDPTKRRWVTKDGKGMFLGEMSTPHLIHALNSVEKYAINRFRRHMAHLHEPTPVYDKRIDNTINDIISVLSTRGIEKSKSLAYQLLVIEMEEYRKNWFQLWNQYIEEQRAKRREILNDENLH